MSWNVEGVKKHIPAIHKLLDDQNIDIMGLQEIDTIQSTQDVINNTITKYSTVISTEDQKRLVQERLYKSGKRQHFGTSLTFKKELEKDIDHITQSDCNIKVAKLKQGETRVLLINVYMPTTGKDHAYDLMCQRLTSIVLNEGEGAIVIGFGDLNIRTDEPNTKRQKYFKQFLHNTGLQLHVPKTFTHRSHSHHTTETTLDYVFTSNNVNIQSIKVLHEDTFPENMSSHFPVLVELEYSSIHFSKDKQKRQRTKEKQVFENHRKIDWTRTDKSLYKKLTESFIKCAHDNFDFSPDTQNKVSTDLMVLAAKMATIKPEKKEHKKRELSDEVKKIREKISKSTKAIKLKVKTKIKNKLSKEHEELRLKRRKLKQ